MRHSPIELVDSARSTLDPWLPFEKRSVEIEAKLRAAATDEERGALRRELDDELSRIFSGISPWQRVQLARHPLRPRMLDYTSRVLDDFIELHGDRAVGDDPAVLGGIGRFEGRTVVVVGHQKGVSTDERVRRNFGMAHPEGYRKALRFFKLAERFKYPVISFVDTPAAHPGIEAEQRGQGPAIAENLRAMLALKTPIYSVVLAEGGSGGALGIALGDMVAMFEWSIYVICPPERCAEILWRDAERKELAASALRITADELLNLGVIDQVLREPPGGAHRDPDVAADTLRAHIRKFLEGCDKNEWSPQKRQKKFRAMGQWLEG
ncbi:MAG: acetyl-CoA carboxylase carboxyltransferase subunit alpha [Candidatus Hydrogenedentes bacterium]|nr:acetyl-CoA carboxylase carboxyltransferase subunit alpha [Candidatus Hydrogenedentota bacterium]